MRKSKETDFFAESDKPEFNQMALYLERIDKRQDERDSALNTGNLEGLYRCTLSLLMNTIPRFSEKKIDFKKVKDDILNVGKKIKGMATLAKDLQAKNSLAYQEDLFECNIRLNELMFKAGMVYPDQVKKSLEEKAKEDFDGKK